MKNKRYEKAEEIIQELDAKTLRAFLTELVRTDEEAQRLLLKRFGGACEEDEWKKRLKDLEEEYEIRRQMDYGKTCRFLEGVMEILREETAEGLKEGDAETVLSVCLGIAETIGRAEMEPEGELDSIGIRLYDTLKRIGQKRREAVRLRLSEFCLKETENPLQPWLEEFLREELEDRDRLEKALLELKSRLKAATDREIPWFSPYHGREDAARKSFQYLKKLGKTPEEIGDFLEETRQAPAVKRLQIRLLEEEGRSEEALEMTGRWLEEEKDPFRRRELERMVRNLTDGARKA